MSDIPKTSAELHADWIEYAREGADTIVTDWASDAYVTGRIDPEGDVILCIGGQPAPLGSAVLMLDANEAHDLAQWILRQLNTDPR